MSYYSVCPDPSAFSDGWDDEPEPDEESGARETLPDEYGPDPELAAHWDEADEGDMRYDLAEEARLFPPEYITIPALHRIELRVARLNVPELARIEEVA
jgi:hypothetical protein